MSFQQLPHELLDAVMGHLARLPVQFQQDYPRPGGFQTLRNARLVCRDWNRAANSHIFRILHLKHGSPREESVMFGKWHHTVDLEVAKRAARRVIVDTLPTYLTGGAYYRVWRDWAGNAEANFQAFADALDRIAELPNLNAVEIRFDRNCPCDPSKKPRSYWNPAYEARVTRQNSLKAVFRAIRARKRDGKEKSNVTCLAFQNLQNVTDKKFEASRLFQSVMVDIRQLHLHVKIEAGRERFGYNLHTEERLHFETNLQAGLLSSLSSQLTTLTLSFNHEWGTMPGHFNGSGLHFPSLQTLHLRLFAISHDNHLDWILRMPVLKALYLSETRIMTHAAVNEEYIHTWNLQTHDWERHQCFRNPKNAVFTYRGRWHYFFGRIKSELKTLTDFRIAWPEYVDFYGDADPWTREPRLAIKPVLSTSRYMVFNWSGCPSPWIYPGWKGEMYFGNGNSDPYAFHSGSWPYKESGVPPAANLAEMHEVDDKKALQDLLQATLARRL